MIAAGDSSAPVGCRAWYKTRDPDLPTAARGEALFELLGAVLSQRSHGQLVQVDPPPRLAGLRLCLNEAVAWNAPQRAVHLDRCGVKVDIRPPETAQHALPHPGCQRQHI
jgi:hypothetical protein